MRIGRYTQNALFQHFEGYSVLRGGDQDEEQKYLKAAEGSPILPKMPLPRRIRHKASRRHLVRECFFFYLLAFVFVFLDLHFVGIKDYYPSFHREYYPLNAAALQATLWALLGPVLWVLQEYILPGNEEWTLFSGLDWQMQRLVLAGAAMVVLVTVFAWRWMLPLWGLAAAVALYLRLSRPKDSL